MMFEKAAGSGRIRESEFVGYAFDIHTAVCKQILRFGNHGFVNPFTRIHA